MKMIALLTRRPGITFEEFKIHYETSHVKLAHKYLGHLLQEYRRNYLMEDQPGANGIPNRVGAGVKIDCVTEMWFRNDDGWTQMREIMSDPDIGIIFRKDEERFLDKPLLSAFVVNEVSSEKAEFTA